MRKKIIQPYAGSVLAVILIKWTRTPPPKLVGRPRPS